MIPTITRSKPLSLLVAGLLILISVSLVFYLVDAEAIIDLIGIQNSYLVLFFIALVGGVSVFTTTSYLAFLYLFVTSGLSFWILGLLAGIAIFIGDLVFFLVGKQAGKLLDNENNQTAARLRDWISSRSLRSVQWFTYLYAGFTPLPNDVLTASLGASKFTLKQLYIPLLIGSIQLQIITAYLFSLGFLSGLVD